MVAERAPSDRYTASRSAGIDLVRSLEPLGMPFVSSTAAEAPLTLALDLGTSSFRALLFDRQGRAVSGSEEQRRYDLTTTPDGGAEADARVLFGLLLATIDRALNRAGE